MANNVHLPFNPPTQNSLSSIYVIVCFLENPYLRLLNDISGEHSVGTRPIFMYVIAVDDNGVRELQKNLNSTASFEFVNSDGQTFDFSSRFTEFLETSFQHYSYALPPLEEDAEGSYTLTLGYCYNYMYIIILLFKLNFIYLSKF